MKKILAIGILLFLGISLGFSQRGIPIAIGGRGGVSATNSPGNGVPALFLTAVTNADGSITAFWAAPSATATNAQSPSTVLSNLVVTVSTTVTNVHTNVGVVVVGILYRPGTDITTNIYNQGNFTNVSLSYFSNYVNFIGRTNDPGTTFYYDTNKTLAIRLMAPSVLASNIGLVFPSNAPPTDGFAMVGTKSGTNTILSWASTGGGSGIATANGLGTNTSIYGSYLLDGPGTNNSYSLHNGYVRFRSDVTNEATFMQLNAFTVSGGQTTVDDLAVNGSLVAAGILIANFTANFNGDTYFNDTYIRPIAKNVDGSLNIRSTNAWSFQTPGTNFTLTFAGTPVHGEIVSLWVSNSHASTAAIMTNAAGIYDFSVASNKTLFTIPAASQVYYEFAYSVNFIGAGQWYKIKEEAPEFALAPGSNVTFATNGLVLTISASGGAGSIDGTFNTIYVTNTSRLNGYTNAGNVLGQAYNINSLLATNGITNASSSYLQAVNANSLLVTQNVTYVTADIFPTGQATNFQADYTFGWRTLNMTNSCRFTGVVNVAAANLGKPYYCHLRNTNGSTYRLSCDAGFRRIGTNDVAVLNNQNAVVIITPDGTGGANPTNHIIQLIVADSP